MSDEQKSIIRFLEGLREQIREKAESDMAYIEETIRIVRSGAPLDAARNLVPMPPGPVRPETNAPSVGDMVLAAAQDLGDVVLDHCKDGNLRERAVALYPVHAEKIKRGIFGAVNYLLGNGTFVRMPGGYRLSEAHKLKPEVRR